MSRSYNRTTSTPANETQTNTIYPQAYKYSGGSGQRPNSAGATRTRNSANPNSTAYGRNNAGTTNIYIGSNPILVSGQLNGAAATASSSRPSSAGHTRPAPQVQPVPQPQYTKSPGYIVPNASNYADANPQGATGTPVINAAPQVIPSLPGYARPKSAGAIRRPNVNVVPTGPTMAAVNPVPNNASYQQATIQKISQNQEDAVRDTRTPRNSTNSQATNQPSQSQHASGSDHWSTSYKLHYGYNVAGNISTSQAAQSSSSTADAKASQPVLVSTSAHVVQVPLDRYQTGHDSKGYALLHDAAVRTTSAPIVDPPVSSSRPSSASSRIRSAIGQSQKYSLPPDGHEEDDGDMGLDAAALSGVPGLRGGDEDDEMDGKPISDSRSHPEMSTPSHSLEIGMAQSSLGIDARNSSIESYTEENIDIGLSTVPNQFCTIRDAIELKKFLVLSNASRGGIVPSSTAVMDMYMVGKVVGVGSYGKVRAAWHRLTGAKVAIKTYDKAKLKDPAHWKRVHSEIKIMEQVSHPRIARMYEAVETPKRMHLIMECLDGGNLCSYVKQKRRLSEDESKRIFFQVLTAIDHLHSVGVTHRDIKLENVLFVDPNQLRDVKLIDFGFSTVCQPGKKLKVFCGTPSYMAPEIVRRLEYDGKPTDMWSLGIFLYALLCGCFPFRAKSYPDLYRRIARGTFAIPEELSSPVKDLLTQLLQVEPGKRISSHTTMRHPWLQQQLTNAPDMARLRQDTAIYISEKPADDIDEEVMAELQRFGLHRDDVTRLVMTKMHASMTTLYYLLLDCVTKKRKLISKRSSANNMAATSSSRKASAGTSSSSGLRVPGAGGTHTYSNPVLSSANAGDYQAAAALLQRQQQQQQQHAQVQTVLQQQLQQAQAQQAQQYTGGGYALRQEYSNRPKSASANRASNTTTQRPLSAYAGRR